MLGAFEYAFLGVVLLLGFFCFVMGTDKMVKLIIGTTLLIVTMVGRSGLLQSRNYHLIQLGENRTFVGLSQQTLIAIVQSIDTVTGIILFLGGMIVMMRYSYLDISFDTSPLSPQMQQIVLVPFALFSLIVGLTVAVLGVDIFSPTKLYSLAVLLTRSAEFQLLIRYLPLCVMLQGLVSFYLVTSLDFGFGERKAPSDIL